MQLPLWVQAAIATCFTWFMTALGASFVFLSKKFHPRLINAMQGTAAGIMIAASFFSLLLPAMERLEIAARKFPPSYLPQDFSPAAHLLLYPISQCRACRLLRKKAKGEAFSRLPP